MKYKVIVTYIGDRDPFIGIADSENEDGDDMEFLYNSMRDDKPWININCCGSGDFYVRKDQVLSVDIYPWE